MIFSNATQFENYSIKSKTFVNYWRFDLVFRKFEYNIFLKLDGSIVNNMERIQENNQHSSVIKVLRQLSNFSGSLIIPIILIFLSCRENAHNNKVFSREN